MIEFRDVSKSYATHAGRKVVLDRLNLVLPWGAKVGVLGRNGAGKSTLLGMISGAVRPDSGQIRRRGAISWPLGFAGSFHNDLTGAQNVRFVARIYGMDTEAMVDFVESFAELGEFMDMPLRAYSSGMRARLAEAGLLVTSHSATTIRSYCTSGLVLERGQAWFFPDVEEAIAMHESNMAA